MLTLAGLTPDDIDIVYREYREFPADEPPDSDLAAITSFTAQIEDAYKIADIYRSRGTKVVLGGLHVTALPEEAANHADAVVVGEGEPVWLTVLDDFEKGRLKARYGGDPEARFDMTSTSLPRYDLLDPDNYNRFPVQTSRGCPLKCNFCASSILLTPYYVHKPVAQVADDNTFANPRYGRKLVDAIGCENVKWFAETDISVAEDDELLGLIAQSGCRQLLVGLESPMAGGLDKVELRSNWKYRKRDRYRKAIERIQSHGITLNGCFVLGLDGDSEEVFDEIPRFVEETGLYDVQVTVMTPFPGTAPVSTAGGRRAIA